MHAVIDLLEGFWTYQTPTSFLAGIGVYHLYCKARHRGVYDEGEDDAH